MAAVAEVSCDVDGLRAILPDRSEAELLGALQASGGDSERALNALLEECSRSASGAGAGARGGMPAR